MAIKSALRLILVNEKDSILLKELTYIERNLVNDRAEGKVSWKSFNSKMEIVIYQIKKSIEALTQTEA